MSRTKPPEEEQCAALVIDTGWRCRKWKQPRREFCGRHPEGSVRFDESNVDPRVAERAAAVRKG